MIRFVYEGSFRHYVCGNIATNFNVGGNLWHDVLGMDIADQSEVYIALALPISWSGTKTRQFQLDVETVGPMDLLEDLARVRNENSVKHVNLKGTVRLDDSTGIQSHPDYGGVCHEGSLPLPWWRNQSSRGATVILLKPGDSWSLDNPVNPGGKFVYRCKQIRSPNTSTTSYAFEFTPGTPYMYPETLAHRHSVGEISVDNSTGKWVVRIQRWVTSASYDVIESTGLVPDRYSYGPIYQYDSIAKMDPLKAEYMIRRFSVNLFNHISEMWEYSHPDVDVYGELATQCTGAYQQLQANVPSTVAELTGIVDEVKSLADSVLALKQRNPARFVQACGNLQLSVKWGLPLTVSDFHSITDTCLNATMKSRDVPLEDKILVQRRSRTETAFGKGILKGIQANCRYTLKTMVKRNNVAREHPIAQWAADYNLISASNGWDLIPYSFVVDWLTDFGSIVDGTDKLMYRLSYYDVVGSVRGKRIECSLGSSVTKKIDPRLNGEIQLVYYTRSASRTIPLPTFGYLSPKLGLDQWIDGSILVGQVLQ
jgi:hypothetical protein